MHQVMYLVILLSMPFLFIGFINRTKSLWAGRKGAPLLQPFYDFRKLLGKGEVISKTTSIIFRLAPSVNVAAVIFAALLVPEPQRSAFIAFPGDFVLFAYSLGLAKFLLIIAALDTGSPFEGMGAAREVTFSSIVEPAFFLLIGSLALVTGRASFESILSMLNFSAGYNVLLKSLCLVSLFIMLLSEGARVPVDDPNTHLELTMIHEVMILDYSGPDLAFMQYAVGLKMVVLATLIINLLIPAGLSVPVGIGLYLLLLVVIAIAIGLVESLIARLRISHVPQFVFLMVALSVTAFAIVIFFLHGGI